MYFPRLRLLARGASALPIYLLTAGSYPLYLNSGCRSMFRSSAWTIWQWSVYEIPGVYEIMEFHVSPPPLGSPSGQRHTPAAWRSMIFRIALCGQFAVFITSFRQLYHCTYPIRTIDVLTRHYLKVWNIPRPQHPNQHISNFESSAMLILSLWALECGMALRHCARNVQTQHCIRRHRLIPLSHFLQSTSLEEHHWLHALGSRFQAQCKLLFQAAWRTFYANNQI